MQTATYNAKKLKKDRDMSVYTEIISKTRFAAKSVYSTDFLNIVKTFEKHFWNTEGQFWTLPIDFHDAFIELLNKKKFIHKKGTFYDGKKDYKNMVFLKINHTDTVLDEYIEDLYSTNGEIKTYIFIQKFTGNFTTFVNDLEKVYGSLKFDIQHKCFVVEGIFSCLIDFFQKKYFDTDIQFLEEIIDSQQAEDHTEIPDRQPLDFDTLIPTNLCEKLQNKKRKLFE